MGRCTYNLLASDHAKDWCDKMANRDSSNSIHPCDYSSKSHVYHDLMLKRGPEAGANSYCCMVTYDLGPYEVGTFMIHMLAVLTAESIHCLTGHNGFTSIVNHECSTDGPPGVNTNHECTEPDV